MFAILVEDKKVVLAEYTEEYKNLYWSILTAKMQEKIGVDEITNPDKVTETLKECFTILCLEFQKAISEISEAAFFLFCNDIHEDSIDLWIKQSEGLSLGIDEEQFAASRRILKIILEQACKLELKGNDNFKEEAIKKETQYIKHLEKLLYVGSLCIELSEEVSKSQLFPNSKGIQMQKGDLTILTYQPYPELFKFVFQDVSRHSSGVQLSNSIIDFKNMLKLEMGIDYDVLASFINLKNLHVNYNYSITNIKTLVKNLSDQYGCRNGFVNDFYEGLTVSSRNVMSIEDCILKNQNSNRYMFRPILEYLIDGNIYNIVGYNKWMESFTTLSTNCFPFGHYPEEWKRHDSIKKFVLKVTDEHDAMLEEPIVEYLKSKDIMVDNNIRSFKTKQGNNIPIDIKGVGEIDLIFIDETNKVIYIGECKHNRSRFDMNNWKRDYSNFVEKYEIQISNKKKWVDENVHILREHFEVVYSCSIDIKNYIIRACFFINAPTIYMYNGKFRAFTFTDLKNIVEGEIVDTIFRFKNDDTKETFDIVHPYFVNLRLAMEVTSLELPKTFFGKV